MPAPPCRRTLPPALSQLEAETQALRAEVQWLREHRFGCPRPTATPTRHGAGARRPPDAAPDQPGDYFTLDELRGEMKKFAWKKGDFTHHALRHISGATWCIPPNAPRPARYTLFVQSASTAPEERVHRRRAKHPAGVRRGRPADSVFQLRPRAAARWKSTSRTTCSRPRTSRPSCCGTPMPR